MLLDLFFMFLCVLFMVYNFWQRTHVFTVLMYFIGNPTVKRVWFFLNHWNQRVGRCVLLNHHECREWNDRNEWWFSRTHRPTSWLKWFRKNHTSLRWDFLLIQELNPESLGLISVWFSVIQVDFSLIQGDSGWFRQVPLRWVRMVLICTFQYFHLF